MPLDEEPIGGALVSRFPQVTSFHAGLKSGAAELGWAARRISTAVAAEAWHILAALMPPLMIGAETKAADAPRHHNFGNSLRTSSAWKIIRRPAFCRTA